MAALDHAPPPFFKRGPAPLALLTFYVAISGALFILDLRFHALDLVRQGLSVVVDPVQRVAQAPLRLLTDSGDYMQTLDSLQAENTRLRNESLLAAPNLARLAHLENENAQLRELLQLQQREKVSGQAASILYSARDPFARKVYLDKGQQSGLVAGQPVIDPQGLVGQITQVYPLSAEVTLVTDKNQAVPVQVLRTGQRSVVFGLGNGQIELKYLPANADIEVGDTLTTSGIDGIYPAGFPVARVTHIERDSAYAFARVICTPLAAVESHATVMVLNPRPALPPRPEAPTPAKPAAKGKRPRA